MKRTFLLAAATLVLAVAMLAVATLGGDVTPIVTGDIAPAQAAKPAPVAPGESTTFAVAVDEASLRGRQPHQRTGPNS